MLKHDTHQGLMIPPEVFNADSFLLALKGSKSRIPLFKKNIERSSDFLHQQFQKGHNIRELIWARSTFIDQLLRCAWQLFDWPDEAISLVAVGGYGRGELHPHSDIDLLILLREGNIDGYQQQTSDFVTLLWDINLDIGHSVRTISECVSEAAQEITVATNLMESRTLIGSPAIHAALIPQLDTDNIWPSREFFRAKWDEQIERHRKHGNSEYNLEPNVKSSPGGLRDIQMIGWIAKRHFGIKNFADFHQQGLLLKEELDILNQGLDFLWRVRYGLHMISGREEDRLLFDHQRTLAKLFGYDDRDQRLAVEKFMQQYYRSALALGQLNDVLIQYFDESILRSQDDDVVTRINERFRIHNGHIEVSHDNVFIETPSALLEVFVLMAKSHNIDGVRASTIRLIRNSTHLIDDTFRNDPVITNYFMGILRSPEKVALQLRRMLRFGVLGKYLPSFGKIIGQMQHDLFHIYSVDAHTMEVVKNMRRFHYRELRHKFPVASRLVKRLDKIELLYIAGLYHDIGKGRGGDHSQLGADDARLFCFRHKLNKRDTNLVCWLVRNHLLMSSVAQRKDISDPDVIRKFAEIVGDQKYLDFIYLLTVADINATNPSLWNSWRASLLRQLYAETKRAFRRGLENPADKQDWIEENQSKAIDSLENLGFIEEEIKGIWSNTEEDYFLREKIDDIVWHTEAIAQHSDIEQPLILLKESSEIDFEGATQIFVHTKNQKNLFAIIASALEQLDLNIQDARIYTSGSGFSLDTFFVLDNDGEPIGNNSGRSDEIIQLLAEYISSPDQHLEIISKRTPRTLRLFSTPTRTSMMVDKIRNYSILEVITPDRPGLLARMGKIFYDFDIQIQNAKITTLGERVEDVFFITNMENKAIEDIALQESIQQAICKELNEQTDS